MAQKQASDIKPGDNCKVRSPKRILDRSENEHPEWLRAKVARVIDEYVDINEGEKQMMKLWNSHMMNFSINGNCQVPYACEQFVILHGKEVAKKKLYRNFCLHLTNLYDYGLLETEHLHAIIRRMHRYIC